jgi:rSAM/selenodomain-associated transferase 2
MNRVSIVIPTLNEMSYLGLTLEQLSQLRPLPWQVIVVDGNSEDGTWEIIRTHQAQNQTYEVIGVRSAGRGRSRQQNQGAALATGNILCFLHADTQVPQDLLAIIGQTLANPKVAGGGFISLMVGNGVTRWGISLHNFFKTYYGAFLFRPHLFIRGLRILFGDQVLFCRTEDFRRCGGFDTNLPIMEDADLCLRLAQYGRICQVNRVVQSSDRRVRHWGEWKAMAIYMMIGFLWGIGLSGGFLKQFYEEIR